MMYLKKQWHKQNKTNKITSNVLRDPLYHGLAPDACYNLYVVFIEYVELRHTRHTEIIIQCVFVAVCESVSRCRLPFGMVEWANANWVVFCVCENRLFIRTIDGALGSGSHY